MFTRRFKLFDLFGFEINADLSWFVILALVTWSLATRVFPADFAAPGLDPATYWLLGFVAALLFFASLLLHEVGHALMARRYRLPIRGITLFLFGGVAEMTEEPPDARTEFLVAVAGPLVSVLLGVLFTSAGLVGLFVRNAARMSYQQLLLRRALEGEPVSRFMEPSPVAVERALPVRELVDAYVYRHHHKTYPVVDGGRLVGCVSTRAVRELPHEEWDRQTVGAIAEPCSEENTVPPDMDAMQALSLMSRTGTSRLLVAEDDRLYGILALKDLLKFFSLKMELGDEG